MEPISPSTDEHFHTELVCMYAGIRVIPCLLARFNMQQASLERKTGTLPP